MGARARSVFLSPPPQSVGRLLFVDLETTGLAGGAGSYAFLVGCAWFEGQQLRVRQFFLSSFAAEGALIDGVTRLAEEATGVVTFNGKSFDLPLLDTRYIVNRMETPFSRLPHVDMLHPARRLWRDPAADRHLSGVTGCRLTSLERTQCGFAREGDVPGSEIPGLYFDYVRSGNARPLEVVLEHNRLDLLSLALLTGLAAQKLEAGPTAAITAREALGLGRLLERGGLVGDSRACYLRATELGGDAVTGAEALGALALSCRRARLYGAAADAWSKMIALEGCPPHMAGAATEALAIHQEHRLRDITAAKVFALRAMDIEGTRSRRRALQYRVARLNRKLTRADRDPQPERSGESHPSGSLFPA